MYHPIKSAIFSPCKKYRYTLYRKFESKDSKPALFIMLNPSTADEVINDPTVSRCINYAKREGCTSLTVVNIFAYRSTDPKALKSAEDPIGPQNNLHILEQLLKCKKGLVVAAWGNHGKLVNRSDYILDLTKKLGIALKTFRVTSWGQPVHPLYQSSKAKLFNLTNL